MQEEIEKLTKEIELIKSRNKGVEADKAWETSNFRKFLIVIFTYIAIALYLILIKVSQPWLNAIVPAVGFTLSTLTLPFIKKWWAKRFYKAR
jgi:hypothetical protein